MQYSLSQLIEMASHRPPATELTVDSAHETMRIHRDCAAGSCPRKMAAFQTLVDAGRVVPDSSRRY
jgi:hypothetical protein